MTDTCRTIVINGKTVRLAEPYRANDPPLIGREDKIRHILAAWIAGDATPPLSPLLIGEPGTGKNRLVYECAGICAKELYIVQGSEDLGPEDLMCRIRESDDPSRKIDYILSPLTTAMVRGGVCFFDEIGKVRPRSLAPLFSLLDNRRYMESVTLGDTVYASAGFRFIAATNQFDFHANGFKEDILSRLTPVIEMDYPSAHEIRSILETHYPRVAGGLDLMLDDFWNFWNGTFGDRAPSPREVLSIFGVALGLADYDEMASSSLYNPEGGIRARGIVRQHLQAAFEQFAKGKELVR